MKRKKSGRPLPRTGLSASKGHRSHVKGRRLMNGPNKSHIGDLLHDDAKRIEQMLKTCGSRGGSGRTGMSR